MKIAIGSDHAGFRHKEQIKSFLIRLGHQVIDHGTDSEAPVDYPLYIRPVALMVANEEADCGVVLGGCHRRQPDQGRSLRPLVEHRLCSTRSSTQRFQYAFPRSTYDD